MLPCGLLHVASDGVASTCGGADAESSSAMNSASIALVPCEKPSTSLVALPNLPHRCSNTYLSPSERSYSYRRGLGDWQMSVTASYRAQVTAHRSCSWSVNVVRWPHGTIAAPCKHTDRAAVVAPMRS